MSKNCERKNRLPLNVMWIDQETEWQGTVDMCKKVMYHPDVKAYWFQIPMVITNNASSYERYFHCWDQNRENQWLHPRDDISLKENKYGTQRFHELFKAILAVEFKNKKTCYISGVRTDETPKRFVSLTYATTYEWITWGSILDKKQQHYTFYPIYDWNFTDVWKAIYDNNWTYNLIYDELYRYGLQKKDMRISAFHHETSKQVMQYVQEIEPITWERLCEILPGANTIGQVKKNVFMCPNELPYMFQSWEEYANYLLNNIVQEKKNRLLVRKHINRMSKIYIDELVNKNMFKEVINTILSSDWDLTKIVNFEIRSDVYSYRKYKQGKKQNILHILQNRYISAGEKERMYKIYEKSGRKDPNVC